MLETWRPAEEVRRSGGEITMGHCDNNGRHPSFLYTHAQVSSSSSMPLPALCARSVNTSSTYMYLHSDTPLSIQVLRILIEMAVFLVKTVLKPSGHFNRNSQLYPGTCRGVHVYMYLPSARCWLEVLSQRIVRVGGRANLPECLRTCMRGDGRQTVRRASDGIRCHHKQSLRKTRPW